jgi:hypothetical protein
MRSSILGVQFRREIKNWKFHLFKINIEYLNIEY